MPDDKRLPYEFDIRVPLIVRPPKRADSNGLAAFHSRGGGSGGGGPYPAGGCPTALGVLCCNGIVLNIDLAPTLLDIAAVTAVASQMDGDSYLWMLEPAPALAAAPKIVDETETAEVEQQQKPPPPLRIDFLVEYHGELEHDDQYVQLKPPVWKTPPFLYFPEGVTASKQQDTTNNTYSCLRTLVFNPPAKTNSTIFCRFYADDTKWRADEEYLTEYYDIDGDPFQMENAAARLPDTEQVLLRARLDGFRACTGERACGRNGP